MFNSPDSPPDISDDPVVIRENKVICCLKVKVWGALVLLLGLVFAVSTLSIAVYWIWKESKNEEGTIELIYLFSFRLTFILAIASVILLFGIKWYITNGLPAWIVRMTNLLNRNTTAPVYALRFRRSRRETIPGSSEIHQSSYESRNASETRPHRPLQRLVDRRGDQHELSILLRDAQVHLKIDQRSNEDLISDSTDSISIHITSNSMSSEQLLQSGEPGPSGTPPEKKRRKSTRINPELVRDTTLDRTSVKRQEQKDQKITRSKSREVKRSKSQELKSTKAGRQRRKSSNEVLLLPGQLDDPQGMGSGELRRRQLEQSKRK